MVLGDPRHAHQRTQSFHFALPHRHSANTRPCCSSAQSPSSLSTSLHALKHSTSGSERVDALGRRAVEVIICMITRDFSVISNDVTGVSLSLSLSLSLSQKSLTHNIGSASALPIIRSDLNVHTFFSLFSVPFTRRKPLVQNQITLTYIKKNFSFSFFVFVLV